MRVKWDNACKALSQHLAHSKCSVNPSYHYFSCIQQIFNESLPCVKPYFRHQWYTYRGTWSRDSPPQFVPSSLQARFMNQPKPWLWTIHPFSELACQPLSTTTSDLSPSFFSHCQRGEAPWFPQQVRLKQNSQEWEPRSNRNIGWHLFPEWSPPPSPVCLCCGSAAGQGGLFNAPILEMCQLPDYGWSVHFAHSGCFPHDSFLCCSAIALICQSNTYRQWHHAGCSFSAAQYFLKETHTWKWNSWNYSWILSRETLATCVNTLLFSNMGTNISYL